MAANMSRNRLPGPVSYPRPIKACIIVSSRCQSSVSIEASLPSIRFESSCDSAKVCSSWLPHDLAEVASLLSQNLIQCHASPDNGQIDSDKGLDAKICAVSPDGVHSRDLVSFRVGFRVVIKRPESLPIPPHKPFSLPSVRNSLFLALHGELVSEGEDLAAGQHFLSRTKFRLRVGWDCIEIYPYTDVDLWNPEFAGVWAENDILAAVAAQQLDETRFQSLDPNAAARNRYAEILGDFRALLDSDPQREEVLQKFLRSNPALLCPHSYKNVAEACPWRKGNGLCIS